MLGKPHPLPRWLTAQEFLLGRALEPDARGDGVVGREQHGDVEAEVWRGGRAGVDHGFVVGARHAPAVVRDVVVDEGNKRGLGV